MPEPFDNLVVDIIAGLIVAAILAALGWLWRPRKLANPAAEPPPEGQGSVTVRAGDRAVTLKDVNVAGDLNIYLDGLPEAKPEVRDPFEEGRRLQNAEQHEAAIAEFEKAFAAAKNDSQRCALHILIGNSLAALSRLPEAEGHYRQALAGAEKADDEEGQAAALGNLGLVYAARGQLDKAEEHLMKALAIHEEIGDRLGQGQDLGNLGTVYGRRGQLAQAEEHHRRALAIDEEIGGRLGQAEDLANLGTVYAERGELDKAEEHHKKALAIFEETGNRLGQAQDLTNLGNIYDERGELDKAEEYHRRALAIDEEIDHRLRQAEGLVNLGLLAARRRDGHRARELFQQAAQTLLQQVGGECPATVHEALELVVAPAQPKRKRPRKKPPPKKP